MGFGPSENEWKSYSDTLSGFASQTAQQSITWIRVTKKLDRFGEDEGYSTQDITLKGLVAYNAFRVWPLNKAQDYGVLDKEYLYILLNNEYLEDNGYLNDNDYFSFNPFQDRFIINGIKYRASGDTPVSQAKSFPLYSLVILERDVVNTPDVQR